jgi:hypothetical protein
MKRSRFTEEQIIQQRGIAGGEFLPPAATPANPITATSVATLRNSARPRPIVLRAIPVMRDSADTPPHPADRASLPDPQPARESPALKNQPVRLFLRPSVNRQRNRVLLTPEQPHHLISFDGRSGVRTSPLGSGHFLAKWEPHDVLPCGA